ncbi:MAG: hypothetical protein KJ600_03775 [Nanoarchaeota archaeon]|nr:hypothetical protein [Nanoarchaeota archaeon]
MKEVSAKERWAIAVLLVGALIVSHFYSESVLFGPGILIASPKLEPVNPCGPLVDGQCTEGCTPCDGSCFDIQISKINCGSCGNVCLFYTSCSGGECVCPNPEEVICSQVCTDIHTDSNCGGCGNMCFFGTTCQDDVCECPDGEIKCSGPYCIDTDSDPANCGGCGVTCSWGQTCENGNCECPDGGG